MSGIVWRLCFTVTPGFSGALMILIYIYILYYTYILYIICYILYTIYFILYLISYIVYIIYYILYFFTYIMLVTARDPLLFLRWWAIRWLIPKLLGLSATCGRNVILVTMFFVLSAAWKLMKLISYGSNKWSDIFMIMVTCVLDTLRMLNISIDLNSNFLYVS